MLLWNFLVSIVTIVSRPFTSHYSPVQPLSGRAREIAHNAFYSTEEMFVSPDHAGIKDTRFRWPGYPGRGIVPYVIHDSLRDIRETIWDAMEQFHRFFVAQLQLVEDS